MCLSCTVRCTLAACADLSIILCWHVAAQGMAWQSSQAGLTMDVAQLASSLASAMRKPQHVVHAAVPGQETTSATGSQTGLSLLQGNAGWAGSEQVLQTPEQERELAVAQLKREVFGLEGDAADNDGGGRQAMADDFLNPTDGEHAAGDAHQYHAEQVGRAIAVTGSLWPCLLHSSVSVGARCNCIHGVHMLCCATLWLQYEAQVLLAQHASTRWPRIYRPPRVRGGHVILDLCMPEVGWAGCDGQTESLMSTAQCDCQHVRDLALTSQAEAADGADSNPEASPSTTAQLERHVSSCWGHGWFLKAASLTTCSFS